MGDMAADPAKTVGGSASSDFSPNAVHLLRTVQLNTLRLSQMADQKASILMGATLLVFSVTIGRSLGGPLPWAVWVLGAFAFVSSLSAVMAVMPSIGTVKRSGAPRNKMFFGHFHDLDEEAWTQDVLGEMHADERVLRLMLHDIYQNGQVLQHRKYRYLGYAYRLLVAGLVATLATFALELALG